MSRIMPAMADGRCFTNYLAACQYDQRIKDKFGITSDAAFRYFLQNNALAVQDETRKLHVCAFAFDTINTGPALPPGPGPAPVVAGRPPS